MIFKRESIFLIPVDFNIFWSSLEFFDFVESPFPRQKGFQKVVVAEEPEESDSEKCDRDDENFLHVNADL